MVASWGAATAAAAAAAGRISLSSRLSSSSLGGLDEENDELGANSNGGNSSSSSSSNDAGNGYEFAYSLSWEHKLELAEGACRGVAALVEALPGYSHNDLKSPNFLVDCPKTKQGGGEPAAAGAGDAANNTGAGGMPQTYVVKIADMEVCACFAFVWLSLDPLSF
jgi:hypothetical protein